MTDLHATLILKQTLLKNDIEDYLNRIKYKLNSKTKQKIWKAFNEEFKNLTQLIETISFSGKKDYMS